MKRRTFKPILVLLVALAVMSTSTLTVFASFGYSADTYKTVYGYTYKFGSLIHNEVPYKIGYQTNIMVTSADSVPAGYMGTRAILYRSDGSFIDAADWSYNYYEGSGELQSGTYYATDGYYFSRGQVQIYNGDGYSEFTAKATPNLAPSNGTRSADDRYAVRRNANGEVYGSDLFLIEIGVEPDLISAVGQNGVKGYIKRTDLDYNLPSNPAEAMEYMANRPARRTIPLYAEDGVTVLGSFVIDNTTPSGELIP